MKYLIITYEATVDGDRVQETTIWIGTVSVYLAKLLMADIDSNPVILYSEEITAKEFEALSELI